MVTTTEKQFHWSSSLISPASLSLSCLVPLHHRLLPHACRCDASAFQRRRHHVFAFTFQDFIAELGRFLPWQRSSSRGSFSFVRHAPFVRPRARRTTTPFITLHSHSHPRLCSPAPLPLQAVAAHERAEKRQVPVRDDCYIVLLHPHTPDSLPRMTAACFRGKRPSQGGSTASSCTKLHSRRCLLACRPSSWSSTWGLHAWN